MPGSIVTTAPTGSVPLGRGAQPGRLMHLQPQAVPQRMPEGVAEPARRQQLPGQRVRLAAGHARPNVLAGPELRRAHRLVDRPLPLVGPAAHDDRARQVRAVAVQLGPEIDQQQLAGGDVAARWCAHGAAPSAAPTRRWSGTDATRFHAAGAPLRAGWPPAVPIGRPARWAAPRPARLRRVGPPQAIASTSTGAFTTRSASTSSPTGAVRRAHSLSRPASRTVSAWASKPTVCPGRSAQAPFRRSQTLAASMSMSATPPTSSGAWVAYRKSVKRIASSGRRSNSAAEPVNPVRYRMFGRCDTSSASSPSAARSDAHARLALQPEVSRHAGVPPAPAARRGSLGRPAPR